MRTMITTSFCLERLFKGGGSQEEHGTLAALRRREQIQVDRKDRTLPSRVLGRRSYRERVSVNMHGVSW